MNYLWKGWQKTFQAIRHRKGLFAVLLLLQVIFFFSFLAITLQYQMHIVTDAEKLITSLEKVNYEKDGQDNQEILAAAAAVSGSYAALRENIFALLFWWLGFLLVGNGLLWLASHYFFDSGKFSWKRILSPYLKYLFSLVAVGIPAVIVLYLLLKSLFLSSTLESANTLLAVVLAVIMVLYYLLLIFLANISSSSWREFFRRFFSVGIRKIHKALLGLVFNFILISIPIIFMYVLMDYETLFLVVLLLSLVVIVVMVITRLFWIATVQELAHETHHH